MTEFFSTLSQMPWLEATGLISGLLCVWLLIRENIWTFPIGMIYALVSVAVFTQHRLYADVLLSGYYVIMNGYGWYYWSFGGERTAADDLSVTFTPSQIRWILIVLTALATLIMGWAFATYTDTQLPYWDSATTCMSFAAMWMTARKYIDNWIVWLIVDIIAATIYLVKGIELYAILYGVYLMMAIMGWRAWHKHLNPASSFA